MYKIIRTKIKIHSEESSRGHRRIKSSVHINMKFVALDYSQYKKRLPRQTPTSSYKFQLRQKFKRVDNETWPGKPRVSIGPQILIQLERDQSGRVHRRRQSLRTALMVMFESDHFRTDRSRCYWRFHSGGVCSNGARGSIHSTEVDMVSSRVEVSDGAGASLR